MSGSNQTTDASSSTSNFTVIFEAASHEYRTLTREDLRTHPFASTLEGYNSPDSILDVFRKQAIAFDKFRKGDDKLMVLLTPIVNILFTFSETLGEGVGLVSTYFSCILRRHNMLFVGFLACEDDFHRNWCPSRGVSTPTLPGVRTCNA